MTRIERMYEETAAKATEAHIARADHIAELVNAIIDVPAKFALEPKLMGLDDAIANKSQEDATCAKSIAREMVSAYGLKYK